MTYKVDLEFLGCVGYRYVGARCILNPTIRSQSEVNFIMTCTKRRMWWWVMFVMAFLSVLLALRIE